MQHINFTISKKLDQKLQNQLETFISDVNKIIDEYNSEGKQNIEKLLLSSDILEKIQKINESFPADEINKCPGFLKAVKTLIKEHQMQEKRYESEENIKVKKEFLEELEVTKQFEETMQNAEKKLNELNSEINELKNEINELENESTNLMEERIKELEDIGVEPLNVFFNLRNLKIDKEDQLMDKYITQIRDKTKFTPQENRIKVFEVLQKTIILPLQELKATLQHMESLKITKDDKLMDEYITQVRDKARTTPPEKRAEISEELQVNVLIPLQELKTTLKALEALKVTQDDKLMDEFITKIREEVSSKNPKERVEAIRKLQNVLLPLVQEHKELNETFNSLEDLKITKNDKLMDEFINKKREEISSESPENRKKIIDELKLTVTQLQKDKASLALDKIVMSLSKTQKAEKITKAWCEIPIKERCSLHKYLLSENNSAVLQELKSEERGYIESAFQFFSNQSDISNPPREYTAFINRLRQLEERDLATENVKDSSKQFKEDLLNIKGTDNEEKIDNETKPEL